MREALTYYALHYSVVDDFINRRQPFREAHLRLVREAHERGVMTMAGALGDPPDGALLIFRANAPEVAEAFARADPYVRQGLVTSWRVRQWTVVAGRD